MEEEESERSQRLLLEQADRLGADNTRSTNPPSSLPTEGVVLQGAHNSLFGTCVVWGSLVRGGMYSNMCSWETLPQDADHPTKLPASALGADIRPARPPALHRDPHG
jgi:hypothetical protein